MNQKQRDEFLEQSRAHLAADILVKGVYGESENGDSFKGCSVGCHLHHIYPEKKAYQIDRLDNKRKRVADYYGYPEWLARLQDAVFEGLADDDAPLWHVQLADTLHDLPDDYDWQLALHRVHAAILRVVLRTAGGAESAVKGVLDLHERAASGENIDSETWSAARAAAWAAALSAEWSAARAAAWAAALSAARAAAEAAAWVVAESTARAAAESAARAAARSAEWSMVWPMAWQEIRDATLEALAGVE